MFQKGDKVRLKTGGPAMVVEHRMASGGHKCLWFDGNERKSGVFDPATLEYLPEDVMPPADSGDYDPLGQWRT